MTPTRIVSFGGINALSVIGWIAPPVLPKTSDPTCTIVRDGMAEQGDDFVFRDGRASVRFG